MMALSTFRYSLTREWDSTLYKLVIVMLNPSTADETADDPTIRRCITFAKRQGFGGMFVVNLYAYRATNPDDLVRFGWPEGAHNDATLRRVFEIQRAARQPILVAWGAKAQAERVERFLKQAVGCQLFSLGVTKYGAPRHPLYVRGDAPFADWPPND